MREGVVERAGRARPRHHEKPNEREPTRRLRRGADFMRVPSEVSGPITLNSMAMLKLVFDMETQDPDDFLCLLFFASHPRVQLKAVTLVPGSQEQVGLVRWALKQLDLPDVRIGAGNLAFDKEAVSPWHWRAFFPKGNCPKSDRAEEAWQVLRD